MKTMLITGANGFIGHYLVEYFSSLYNVVAMVRPNANLDRFRHMDKPVQLVYHDITQPISPDVVKDIDIILHAGGNPSSASSLESPTSVVYQNVLGTVHLLELAIAKKVSHFVYYGAGESYGSMKDTAETIDKPYDCNSPYAASKSAGEEFCAAYSRLHGLRVSILHITNTFGERCQKERLPIVALKKILAGEPVQIVSVNGNPSGRRWFHAQEVAIQTAHVLNNQNSGFEKWNCAGDKYITNIEFVNKIAAAAGKSVEMKLMDALPDSHAAKVFMHSLDPQKFLDQGCLPADFIDKRIERMVRWYLDNPSWL